MAQGRIYPVMSANASDPKRFEAARRARQTDTTRQTSALRLYGLLRSSIRQGHIPHLTHLVEDQLVIDYKMSRNAVRRALSLLAEDGLVSRGPRHGTVVVGAIASLALDDPRGEDPERVASYNIVTNEEGAVPVTALLAEKLQTDADTIHMCERICYRFGQPYSVHTTYWHTLGSTIRPSITDFPGRGFHELFADFYGVELGRVDYSVESVTCDETTARALDVELGTALIFLERVQIDVNGRPLEYSHTLYIASRIALTFSSDFVPRVQPRSVRDLAS